MDALQVASTWVAILITFAVAVILVIAIVSGICLWVKYHRFTKHIDPIPNPILYAHAPPAAPVAVAPVAPVAPVAVAPAVIASATTAHVEAYADERRRGGKKHGDQDEEDDEKEGFQEMDDTRRRQVHIVPNSWW